MFNSDEIKISDIDPEDFVDSLGKLEKSFGAKFAFYSFKEAKTFGDICDIIQSQLELTDKNDCTTQQAFYKLRKTISCTQNIEERNITPATKLEFIFPELNRRQNIQQFQLALGFSVNILTMKTWLAWSIGLGFLISIIALFINGLYAFIGFSFFALVTRVADKTAKELDLATVGELTKKISREQYASVRRQCGTLNRNEIVRTIQDLFIADHFLKREHLTREASLGRE